ncbi:MAG TPA: hypothetical protein VND93_16490 [Myxococcales bacterium]|nr:hypothetical protein [Myxococcales bacterium]
MQDQLPDVLNSAGLTPHEVGWLQLHAEPVLRADDGRAVAELWVQAAFDPPGSGWLEVVDAATGDLVGEVPLPPVANGATIRWRIPLQLGPGVASLRFRVDAPIPEDAQRVRSPWKLLDTIELRLPEDDDAGGGLALAARMSGLALGGMAGAAVVAATKRTPGPARRASGMKVHPASARPRDVVSEVVPAGPEEKFDAVIETLWLPGDALEGDALKQRLRAHRSQGPICPTCGAELVPGGEFCPRCLNPVAAVAAAAGARAVGPDPEAQPAPEPAADPGPDVVHCSLHPDQESTGVCTKCGLFFCGQCVSPKNPSLCADCVRRQAGDEAQKLPPLSAALVHALTGGLILVRTGLYFALTVPVTFFPVLPGVALVAMGALLRFVKKPYVLYGALAVDLVVIYEALDREDWVMLAVAALALGSTAFRWVRLVDFTTS